MTVRYLCPHCGWITETDTDPTRCDRCQHDGPLTLLTPVMLAELFAAGEVVYCEACQRVHSGPLHMKEA